MGAGNPLLRSFDNDKYDPTTYYLDFVEMSNKDSENEEDSETIYDAELEYEMFNDDFFFNLSEPFENLFEVPHKTERYIDELSAAFRGNGYVIAQNDDCLVITSSDGDYHHFPITLIPNFKYEEILDEYWHENKHKIEWYEARNKDYDKMCESKADVIYEKKLDKWKEKYEPFMKWFHSVFKDYMSVRNGAWTCSGLSKVESENYTFL